MKLAVASHMISVPDDFFLKELHVGKFDGKIKYLFENDANKRGLKFIFWPNGQLSSKWYLLNGLSHRDPKEGPAICSFDLHGNPISVEYLVNGKYHRDPNDGPAIKSFDSAGHICSEEYRVNGAHIKPKSLFKARFDPKELG